MPYHQGIPVLVPENSLAPARLRGLEARKRLLEAEGGTLRRQQVAALLNISRQAAYKRYRAGRLLAVDCGRHGFVFPAWQFVPGGVLPGLEEALAALADFEAWMKLALLPGEERSNRRKNPIETLRRGS